MVAFFLIGVSQPIGSTHGVAGFMASRAYAHGW
jgi:hypothetical protein